MYNPMKFKGSLDAARRADVTDATYVPEERRKIALEQALPGDLGHELKSLRESFQSILARKKEASLRDSVAPADLTRSLIAARDVYFHKVLSYRDQYPEFFSPISRKNISVDVPPPPADKHAAGHTIPVASSSLTSIFPGNYPHYQNFLGRHNALYHGPETLSAAGGMFIEPPRLKRPIKDGLLEFQQRQHAIWREAPWVNRQNTRADVLRLLSHYDADFTAFVVEPRGKNKFNFIGVVDRDRLIREASTAEVKDFMMTDIDIEGIRDIEPLAAAHKLKKKPYLIHIDEDNRPKILTRQMAGWLTRHNPFRHVPLSKDSKEKPNNRGLGYVSYIGVNDKDAALKEIERLYKKGQRRFMIETAHMHRTDTVYHVLAEARQRWPDIFIATGTVSTAEGVVELSTFADAIKCGIAFGDICDTNEVAIQPAELEMQLECGAAAEGVVSLIIDNLGTRKPFLIKLGTQECIAVQGGGSIATRRDSANPIGLDANGNPCKRVDGEAGLAALKRGQEAAEPTIDQHIDGWLGYHLEGRTGVWKRVRTPDTYIGFLNELVSAPKSTESYTGHDNLASFQGTSPGEGAELQIVRGQNRQKSDTELYVPIRPEEVDIFDDIKTYQEKFI